MLEQCLSGANMATSVIQKANARLKFLYRKRKVLNLTTKKLLVMSLISVILTLRALFGICAYLRF